MTRVHRALRLCALIVLASCAAGVPEAIVYGMDLCALCRMQVDDKRFGALLVTAKGRTIKFDSIECLRNYANTAHIVPSSMWVSDFSHPGTMVRADSATFINIGAGRTPMGRGWAAFASDTSAAQLHVARATAKRWEEIS